METHHVLQALIQLCDPSEREHVKRKRPALDLRQLAAIGESDKREEALNLLLDSLRSSELSETTYARQIEILEEAWRYRHFVSTQLPILVAQGRCSAQPQIDNNQQSLDALDYTNVPALIERIKLFLAYRVLATRGLFGNDEDSASHMITSRTLRACARAMQFNVLEAIYAKETLDIVKKAVERVLRHDPSGKSGLVYQTDRHCELLIKEHKLLSTKKAPGLRYGRPEVELLLEALQRTHLTNSGDMETAYGLHALIQLCYLTGCRTGSFCADTVILARNDAVLISCALKTCPSRRPPPESGHSTSAFTASGAIMSQAHIV